MSNPNTECVTPSIRGMRYTSRQYCVNYVWVIENLSSHHDAVLTSPTFSSENNTYGWFLELGTSILNRTYQYNYVKVTLKPGEGAFAKYGPVSGNLNLAILNTEGTRCMIQECSFEILSYKSCVEINNYVQRWALHENRTLLPNGELRIHCKVSYILKNDLTYVPINIYPIEMPELDAINLEKYFNSEEVSDIDIYVGDKRYPAHKFILAARSPVFKAMFTHDAMIENQQNRIDIQDIDKKTFEQMLRYMYTGKVDNLQSVAFELLPLADKYDMGNLKVRCEIEIANMLTVKTAVKTLLFSDAHNLSRLKKWSIDYIKEHLAELKKSKYWSVLTSHQNILIDILEAF